jgi:putative YhdH/YhfP family quinone oxidoreductase
MDAQRFLCYLVEKNGAGQISAAIAEKDVGDLPPGEVLIEVEYSSLNFKDALSATGNPGVTKKFPHVPGIDLAGRVVASDSPKFKPGDAVLATSYDLGANRWGGYAGLARVPADWVVPLPPGLTARESMIYGTAGLTAAMSLAALEEHHITPDRGEIVVTGASGGVGTLAVALLAKTGYQVTAVTGKPQAADFLRSQCGAANVIGRDEVNDHSGKPLLPARFAGAIDTVGGNTLATLVRSTQRGGCVTACGLVGGVDLPLSVHPFILRGVTLAGIDSAECPYDRRVELWNRLAGPWKLDQLEAFAEEVDLGGLHAKIEAILAGQIQGRVIVRPVAAF